jgi:hypothetical protein
MLWIVLPLLFFAAVSILVRRAADKARREDEKERLANREEDQPRSGLKSP